MTEKEFETAVENIDFNNRPVSEIVRDYCEAFIEFKRSQDNPVDVVSFNEDKDGNLLTEDGKKWTDNEPFLVYMNLATSKVSYPSEIGASQTLTTEYKVDWRLVTVDDVMKCIGPNCEDDIIVSGTSAHTLDDVLDSDNIEEEREAVLGHLEVLLDKDNNNGEGRFVRFAKDIESHFNPFIEGNDIESVNRVVTDYAERVYLSIFPDEKKVLVYVRRNGRRDCQFNGEKYLDAESGAEYESPLEGLEDGVDYRVWIEVEDN